MADTDISQAIDQFDADKFIADLGKLIDGLHCINDIERKIRIDLSVERDEEQDFSI